MKSRIFPPALLLLVSMVLVQETAGQSGTRSGRYARRRTATESAAPAVVFLRPLVALEGHDIVALRRDDQLVAGDAERVGTFDGQIYRFASDAHKQAFAADPKAFAPALGGDSVVAWADQHHMLPGSIRHRVLRDQRLFLFTSDKEKAQFLATPAKYQDADLLLGGISPVALVDAEAIQRGSEQFCELFEGRRVFLASAQERATFRANPGKYFPTFAGVDPVSVAEEKPQMGSPDCSVVYKNRLYLFASGDSRSRFIEAPQSYSDLDVALEGACPVLYTETRQLARGHYGISTVCLGRRFLFQTEEQRKRFADEPTRYLLELAKLP